MVMAPCNNILRSWTPVLWVGGVIGVSPLPSERCDSDRLSARSKSGDLYYILLLFTAFACSITHLSLGISLSISEKWPTAFIVVINAFFADLSTCMSLLVAGVTKRSHLLPVFSEMEYVDNEIFGGKANTIRKNSKRGLIVQLMFLFTFLVVVCTVSYDMWWNNVGITVTIFLSWANILLAMVNFIFVNLVLEVVLQLRQFNDKILEFVGVCNESELGEKLKKLENSYIFMRSQHSNDYSESMYLQNQCTTVDCTVTHTRNTDIPVSWIACLYSRIYWITSSINEIYSIPLLAEIISASISITSTAFVVITLNSRSGKNPTQSLHIDTFDKALLLTAALMWTVMMVTKIVAPTAACHAAVAQSQRTRDIVERVQLLREMQGAADAAHLERLLHRLHPLRFTASGFFDIDLPLLVGAVASIATYLVVLFQF